MSKITLILDSTHLTEAQRCPRADFYSRIENWESKKDRKALTKGGFIHDALKLYYQSKKDGAQFAEIKDKIIDFWQRNQAELADCDGIEVADTLLIFRRIMEYCKYDWNSHRNWEILAVEQGFSVKLYEDTSLLYIYEGRIDLVISIENRRCVVDHKSQSMKYDWPLFSNQMMGYCYASDARYAMYNYIGLQQDVNDNTFRGQLERFRDDQIEQWRRETIDAYNQIVWNMLFNRYNRNRSSCQTRFGLCRFYEVCQTTTKESELAKLESDFKKRETPWRAWE